MRPRSACLALLALCLMLPAAALATTYSASTTYRGHTVAADSCLIEFSPDYTVGEVAAELADAGHPLRSVSMPDGEMVLTADVKAIDVYRGDEVIIGVIDLDPNADLESQLARVGAAPGVRSVAPNYIHFPSWTPNDPLYSSRQSNFRQIYVDKAWDLTKGSGATVAVIDTGYLKSGLKDRAQNVLTGYDFWGNDSNVNDYIGHGTHVSNTVVENTNNGVGCAGIAFQATLMPLKVFPDYDDGALESDIVSAINYAVSNGADVINMSLGGGGYYGPTNSAISNAFAHEVVVVAASGNSGGGTVEYPGAYEDCIAVGATNGHSVGGTPSRASFSNYGSALDLSAPGVNITQETLGYYGGVGYEIYSGTSMASPHVAAVAALLVAHGGADASAIRQAMYDTANNPAGKWTNQLGWGEVDAYAAAKAYGGGSSNQAPVAVATASPNSGAAPLNVTFNGNGSYDPDGSIATWTWKYENAAVSNQPAFVMNFPEPGVYNVVLQVTDNAGASDAATVTVQVSAGGDDDSFDDSDCGQLLEIVYNTCDLRLVFSNGQSVDGENAFTMCESGSPAEYWECLQSCRGQVDNCTDMRACAKQKCNIAMNDASSGDDDDDNGGFLWGCGG